MRWLNPSATLNLRKPSQAFERLIDVFFFDELRVLRFMINPSKFRVSSTTVRLEMKKPELRVLWFLLSSGERIRTTDLRVMRVEPEIVTFDLRSRPFYEPLVRWFR